MYNYFGDKMNIYDFDNTIYEGDTGVDMVLYGLKKHPFKVIKCIIKGLKLRKKYKSSNIGAVKEEFFALLYQIKDLDKFIDSFIDSHIKNIKPWYKSQQKENDTIISASYDLWINPFCERLGIKNIICTKVDDKGKIIGENCKGEEKVKRFREEFPNAEVLESYSDSSTDIPMLLLAKKPFIVDGNKIKPYSEGSYFPIDE